MKKNFEYFVLFYLYEENVLNTYKKIFSNFPFFLILILYDFEGHFMIDVWIRFDLYFYTIWKNSVVKQLL